MITKREARGEEIEKEGEIECILFFFKYFFLLVITQSVKNYDDVYENYGFL